MSKKMDKNQSEKIILTQEGFDELKAELKELQEVKMPKVVARISNAREQGDLSENSDYHSALDEQAMLHVRIDQIEDALNKAEVVVGKSGSTITLGSKVELDLVGKKKKFTYTMAGEYEANPSEGKLSIKSPVGKALLGKKKSDKVEVKTPAGKIEYKILNVS